MMAQSRSGSKTSTASESDPSEARLHPSFRCTFAKVLASPFKFAQAGNSGLWISELFPELAKQADKLCLLRGMHTDVPAHSQDFLQMHTGMFQFKRPSMGAWTFYGLGTDNENLPGFVTLSPPLQNGGPSNYGSAFLPAVYQGTPIGGNQRLIRELEQRTGVPLTEIKQKPDGYQYSSPLTEIGKVQCPVLMISGRNDPNAPLAVMDAYVDALRATGREAEAYHPDNGPHGFYFGIPKVIPETAESTGHAVAFIKKHFDVTGP